MKFLPMTLPLLLLAAAPAQADLLSGRVLDSAGQPLPACNLDVVDVVTGVDMALAGDTTDAAGQFTIDVPTGLYTVTVNPPPGSAHLVGLVDGVAVFGATNMGDVQLEPGAFLDGTILLPSGLPAVGANLDVELADGEEYFPAEDTTDDNGTFSMVVPLGEVALQVRPETLTTTLLAPARPALSPSRSAIEVQRARSAKRSASASGRSPTARSPRASPTRSRTRSEGSAAQPSCSRSAPRTTAQRRRHS